MSQDSIAQNPIINLRCSSLPRVAMCPASATPPSVKIDLACDAAEMVTAVHGWLAARIMSQEPEPARDEVDQEEFATLCRMAWASWERLKPIFTNPVTEYSYPSLIDNGFSLTGTADLLSLADSARLMNGLDWKSGWRDGDHEQQMRGYAWLAMNDEPDIDFVRWHVLNIRFGTVDVYQWGRDELAAWWFKLTDGVRADRETYRPSPEACGFCPRFAECPARNALIRAAAEQILATDDPIAMALPPESLARIVERGRMLEKAAKFAVDIVRAIVVNAGGKIALNDGRVMQIKASSQTKIDPRIALPLISEKIGDRLPEVITIGKGDLETEIKALAPRGQKGKAVEEFLYELDRAGALSLKEIQKLEIVKASKEIK